MVNALLVLSVWVQVEMGKAGISVDRPVSTSCPPPLHPPLVSASATTWRLLLLVRIQRSKNEVMCVRYAKRGWLGGRLMQEQGRVTLINFLRRDALGVFL